MRATTVTNNGFKFSAFKAVPLFSRTFLLSAYLILTNLLAGNVKNIGCVRGLALRQAQHWVKSGKFSPQKALFKN
jgi:hypothetical protein